VFRELGYGVLFYLSAISGAIVCGTLWSSHVSHGPEENAQWLVEGAIGGAIIGGGCWLWFKYNMGRPRELGCGIVLLVSAVLGLVAFILSGRTDDTLEIAPMEIGLLVSVFAWLVLARLLPKPRDSAGG
jgi:hypothetical protein